MSRVPCPCPSFPPCTWLRGRAVAEVQLGQFTFMTPKPNKMRIGIDPQVLSRAIKHRFQKTGTAGEPAALGWVPGVWWGMWLWWRWVCREAAGTVGSPEPLTVSLCHGVWLCWAGQSCLPAPGTRGCENGRVGAHSWSWPQVGGQVSTSGGSCARG